MRLPEIGKERLRQPNQRNWLKARCLTLRRLQLERNWQECLDGFGFGSIRNLPIDCQMHYKRLRLVSLHLLGTPFVMQQNIPFGRLHILRF